MHGVPENLLSQVQNAAARLLTSTLRRDHITPGVAPTPLTASTTETSRVQDGMSGTPISERQQHRRTCLPTFNSSLSMVDVISAHLPTGHSLFHAHVPLSATEVLLSQDRACGTVYRLLSIRQFPLNSCGQISYCDCSVTDIVRWSCSSSATAPP